MTIREIYKNSEQFLNKEVKLGGWIRSIRGSKHFGFLVLHINSCHMCPLKIGLG